MKTATQDRMRGCLLGLAVGDAVGTTVEFKQCGHFTPLTDMVGGGPFNLKPGQWTDDTSMALCLAESLIAKQGFDARDQMERYILDESLEAALWCFHQTNTFRDAILKAVNLGDDADTTAAICGQLAGAHYGESGIPPHWLDPLHMRPEITTLADKQQSVRDLKP